MEKNIFEFAVRNKLRFPFRGQVSVEDLWDLTLENLDSVFKTLNAQIKQTKEESLLDKKTKEDEVLATQIEIVKYIVAVKIAESKVRLEEKAKREQKQKILAVLASKKEEEIGNKSIEELEAMLNELD